MRWKTVSKGRLWAQDFVLWKQTPAVNLEMSVLCFGKNVWLSLKEGFFFFFSVFPPSVIFPVELNYTSVVASNKVV